MLGPNTELHFCQGKPFPSSVYGPSIYLDRGSVALPGAILVPGRATIQITLEVMRLQVS